MFKSIQRHWQKRVNVHTQKRSAKKTPGFTVVEVTIASATFAIILLIGLVAFTQIGRTYYKGVTIGQTRTTATDIFNEVSDNIKLGSGVTALGTASQSRYYYCVGSHRYTFQLYKLVDQGSHDDSTKFGLLEDTLPGNGGCGNPFDSPAVPLVSPIELLGNQMRLLAFDISPITGQNNLFSLSLKIAHGPDATLTKPDGGIDQNSACQTTLSATQFCAITGLSTIVYEGP